MCENERISTSDEIIWNGLVIIGGVTIRYKTTSTLDANYSSMFDKGCILTYK